MGIKERPILFSGPMVRAILEGRKTVTRRAMKIQPDDDASVTVEAYNVAVTNRHGEQEAGPEMFGAWWRDGESGCKCPYGQPGDRLWVRESYQVSKKYDNVRPRDLNYERGISTYYAAGGSRSKDGSGQYVDYDTICVPDWIGKMRPSIFMPRAACRILLEITDVRVERLQDISEEQARAEGITDGGCHNCGYPEPCGCEYPVPSAVDSFVHLWTSTGGDWDANPWVWVVEFKRVMPSCNNNTPIAAGAMERTS